MEEYLKDLKQYRLDLLVHEQKQSNLWDTHLLASSGALLGFSLAFLKELSQRNTSLIPVLHCSWFFLLLATISALSSFKTAELATKSYRKQLDKQLTQSELSPIEFTSKWTSCTTVLNIASFIFFLIGTALNIKIILQTL